jgi:hypothetical protein
MSLWYVRAWSGLAFCSIFLGVPSETSFNLPVPVSAPVFKVYLSCYKAAFDLGPFGKSILKTDVSTLIDCCRTGPHSQVLEPCEAQPDVDFTPTESVAQEVQVWQVRILLIDLYE